METFHRYQCLWIIHSRKYDCIGESHRSTLSDRREFFLKHNQRNNNSLVSRSCKVRLFSHSIFLLVDLWSSLKIKVKQMLSDEKNSHLFWTFFNIMPAPKDVIRFTCQYRWLLDADDHLYVHRQNAKEFYWFRVKSGLYSDWPISSIWSGQNFLG